MIVNPECLVLGDPLGHQRKTGIDGSFSVLHQPGIGHEPQLFVLAGLGVLGRHIQSLRDQVVPEGMQLKSLRQCCLKERYEGLINNIYLHSP